MVGGWCAGQSVPLPAACAGLVLCPWFSPDGAGVWSQQGLWDEQPPTVAVFRVLLPPRPGHRFSRSLGPLTRVLALVAYASRAEPGNTGGRSREHTPSARRTSRAVQGVKVGARIAPNAFATADGGDCTEAPQVCLPRGVSFLDSRQSVPPSYRTKHRHEKITCDQERKTYCR